MKDVFNNNKTFYCYPDSNKSVISYWIIQGRRGFRAQIITGIEKAHKKVKIKKPDPVKKAVFIVMCLGPIWAKARPSIETKIVSPMISCLNWQKMNLETWGHKLWPVTNAQTFTRLRQMLLSHDELKRKIEVMEKKYDENFKIVFEAIKQLIEEEDKPKKNRIGYTVKEKQASYGRKSKKKGVPENKNLQEI